MLSDKQFQTMTQYNLTELLELVIARSEVQMDINPKDQSIKGIISSVKRMLTRHKQYFDSVGYDKQPSAGKIYHVWVKGQYRVTFSIIQAKSEKTAIGLFNEVMKSADLIFVSKSELEIEFIDDITISPYENEPEKVIQTLIK